MIITDSSRQQELEDWAFARGIFPIRPEKATFIGNELNGKIVAVTAYDRYNKRDKLIMMHIASESKGRWLSKDFFWYMFAYPFLQLKVDKIVAPVRHANSKALAFVKALGFKEIESHEDIYNMTLFKSTWLQTFKEI